MKKIIILGPPGGFSKRDYERFGMEFLKKNFSVKFLDFTPWIFPNLWKEFSNESYKGEEHTIISCKEDFLSFNLETDPVIVLDWLNVKNIKANWVREELKKRNKDGEPGKATSMMAAQSITHLSIRLYSIRVSFCVRLYSRKSIPHLYDFCNS